MKIRAKRKLSKKKVKKTEKLISVSSNYHIKKVDNTILKDEKLSEKDIKEKLKNIYQLIKKNTYEKKPIELYLNITESPLVNENDKKSLNKISSITQYKLISPIEILYKYNYEKINKISNEKDKCSICQFNFYENEEDIDELKNSKKKKSSEIGEFEDLIKKEIDVVLLNNCHDHFFHIECLNNLIGEKNNFKCPNCSIIYGILIGEQPFGYMKAYISDYDHCDGYENEKTIIIDYNFPSGKGYSGTYRTAYLPNNKEGKEILGLLKVCFDRKLTFVVGTSVTTGKRNTTVWNGVHHKTSLYGGPTCFGYPDPTYFNRVKEELAAKGVIQDNIDEDVIKIADDLLGE
jgi:deltex-like protein